MQDLLAEKILEICFDIWVEFEMFSFDGKLAAVEKPQISEHLLLLLFDEGAVLDIDDCI